MSSNSNKDIKLVHFSGELKYWHLLPGAKAVSKGCVLGVPCEVERRPGHREREAGTRQAWSRCRRERKRKLEPKASIA